MKTADLIGTQLDYAVALALEYSVGVVTVEEQWDRFIDGETEENLAKYAAEYAAAKATFKTEMCKIYEDGYKSAHEARVWNFSTNWAVAGPLIEREKIELHPAGNEWSSDKDRHYQQYGPTPLIAAMRCYCCAKLGDEVEIPQELQPCHQPNL